MSGCCSTNSMDQGTDYTCPMHPEVKSQEPGVCPKCGMDFVPEYEQQEGIHDHSMMHGGAEMARDFLRRFFIVTILLVPLAATSHLGIRFLGIPDFALRHYLQFVFASAIFYFGVVFFEHAAHEIKSRQYGMMTLVSLAVGAGYLFSAVSTFVPAIDTEFYLEIATLIWVLLFGHYLEAKSSSAAGNALSEVAKLLPGTAHLLDGEGVIDIEVSKLKKGDVVLVRPGEKVPADGVITEGESHFNEAHLTGESVPMKKAEGERAIAGAIAIDSAVKIRLDKVGEHSTIGQIQSLIAKAQQTKPSAQRLADKAAKWLTFTALFVSISAFLVWSVLVGQTFVFSITLAITVLVIACPHALGLAIPTVSTIATRMAVKNGLFIKDMGKLEIVKNADYVVFDKTGTLTMGEFGVTDIELIKGSKKHTESRLLQIASSLEERSSHVIGMAIVSEAKKRKLKPLAVSNFKNVAGMGISGSVGGKKYFIGNRKLMEEKVSVDKDTNEQFDRLSKEGKTVIYVADDRKVIGLLALSDRIKPETGKAIKELHDMGIKVAMLTGDSRQSAQAVAKELNIDTVFAEVLPEIKYEYIKNLQRDGKRVVMAGDGVNDAPALTQADVGVAIGAGTDVAVEAGDVVLTQSNPGDAVKLIVLAKKVYRKMIENLVWALGYNIIAIPAAAGIFIPFGIRITPEIGALLMSGSSVVVVINAMTLRNIRLTKT